MRTKAIFLDIDGTLVSFRTHRIPQSAVDALARVHAAGVRVYIATGRPMAIIDNLGQIVPLVDGYVMCNGAWCVSRGREVCLYAVPPADVATLVADAGRRGYPLVLATEERMAVCGPRYPLVEDIFVQMLGIRCLDFHTPVAEILARRVVQAVAFVDADGERLLTPRLTGCSLNRWHPQFVDITCQNTDKAQGIAAIAAYEGIAMSETMAVGDGGNDIPMLRAAGIGVAMGNASDEVRRAADRVTTSVDDDGLARALRAVARDA